MLTAPMSIKECQCAREARERGRQYDEQPFLLCPLNSHGSVQVYFSRSAR